MNFGNETAVPVDPWQGKSSRFVLIVVVTLALLSFVAGYDGIRFYSRFRAGCELSPNKSECKGFETGTDQPKKHTLDITLDYGRGNYAIQVGAFKREENATSVATALQNQGIQSRVVKVSKSRQGPVFQVQFGRFLDIKTANQAASKLREKGIVKEFVVGTFVLR